MWRDIRLYIMGLSEHKASSVLRDKSGDAQYAYALSVSVLLSWLILNPCCSEFLYDFATTMSCRQNWGFLWVLCFMRCGASPSLLWGTEENGGNMTQRELLEHHQGYGESTSAVDWVWYVRPWCRFPGSRGTCYFPYHILPQRLGHVALGLSSAERIKEKQQKERCPGVNPKWKLGKGFPSKDAACRINSQNIYELLWIRLSMINNLFTKCSLGLPYSFVLSTIVRCKDTPFPSASRRLKSFCQRLLQRHQRS